MTETVQSGSQQRMVRSRSNYDPAPLAEKAGSGGSGRSLRFAYADPPYYGLAAKFYGHLHTEAADYDKLETHAALIAKLCAEYDGWAMSLHTPTLRDILPLCPPDVRVMAWVKPFASFKPGVGVAYAWEPLIVRGGRRRTREQFTVRDWCACNITLRRGFTGAKPEGVIEWLLEVLNVEREDVFDDLFHGSGAVSRAVANYFARPQLGLSVGGGGAEQAGDEDLWTNEGEAPNTEISSQRP